MKYGMRERLSGAIILLALAVIFLPMLFDDPVSRDERPQPMLSIEAPLDVERVEVDDPQPPSRLDETSRDVEGQQNASAPAQSSMISGNDDPEASQESSAASEDAASDSAGATTVASRESTSASEAAAPQNQADTAGAEQSADPIAELARAAEAKRAASGDWSVQAGSFGEPGNAERLAKKLETQGFNVFSRPRGNDLTAVYVGPYASAEDGERARSELKAKANLQGLVVRMSP
ncbi:DedD protein [Onishia taeanensis]|uniref:DedD protein n=1 Tax=Onishia taeanensis TaxID=284577 RepID=A0A328XY24_9GAMM|nr:SPOR domain-containing protein [Halomonas taeanensis]RAR64349.1 DedD protein [Halomonas taeanensis]